MSTSNGKFQLPSTSALISGIFGLSKQKEEEIIAADDHDDAQTQKHKWMKTLISKLGGVRQRGYLSIYGRGRKEKIRGEYCIYRVPDKLRKVKEDAYRPGIVSIGPLHQDKQNLVPMVQHKWSYLVSFLDQQPKDAEQNHSTKCAIKCLEECINAIHGLDEVIRQCYTEKINYTEYELAEIMLLDGCFILELFLRFSDLNYMKKEDLNSDPVLRSAWMTAALQHDLALLENQIPFFILELLYDTIKPHVTKCKPPDLVAGLALNFFHPLSKKKFINEEPEGTGFKHLLDLLHKFYFHPPGGQSSIPVESISENEHEHRAGGAAQKIISCLVRKIKRGKRTPCLARHHQRDLEGDENWGFKYCTSDLLESGIELQVGSSEDSLLEITFRHGVIIIPQLRINETTSSVLRNLIAYEQCSLCITHSVTSYAFLLKSLIGSSRDINLLRTRSIIEHNNRIGDKKYLTQFESILDEVAMKEDFFGDLFDQVNKYRRSWYSLSRLRVFLSVQYQRHRRILCTTYFSTTWRVISLMAGAFLLLLTFLQTYYTIHPRK